LSYNLEIVLWRVTACALSKAWGTLKMANAQNIKSEFDRAKRELLAAVMSGEGRSEEQIQAALDLMTRSFNALLVSTLDDFADRPRAFVHTQVSEFTCVYAVNFQNGWDGSDWRVVHVHGKPVENEANPPTLRDFTCHMIEDGWELVTASECEAAAPRVSMVDGTPVHELYFRRQPPRPLRDSLAHAPDMVLSAQGLARSAN
jgi:hypothetical protein